MTHIESHVGRSDPRHVGESTPEVIRGGRTSIELMFTASPVEALSGAARRIGGVDVWQSEESRVYRCSEVTYADLDGLPTQRTVMHELWTRPGQLLTIARVEMTMPDEDCEPAVQRAMEKAERALALTAAVLDERIIDHRLGEYVVVRTDQGDVILNVTRAVRTFDPSAERKHHTTSALDALADVDISSDTMGGPLELYLHAMERRYTAEGFLLLAAVVDELAHGGAFNPRKIHTALQATGFEIPFATVQKVSTTRGQLTHNGTRALLDHYDHWYDLEEWARVLLRHHAGVTDGWPTRVPMVKDFCCLPSEKEVADQPNSSIKTWADWRSEIAQHRLRDGG